MSSPHERLNVALVELAAHGQRPPCGSSDVADLFTSEDEDERARATALCGPCPLFHVCGEVGADRATTWGVWGGRDYSQTQFRAARKKSA